MRYSHSSIETFKTCPLQFKYNYIEKPDIKKKQNAEAFMGSMVHDTLEKLYKDLKYNKINTIEEVLAYYNSLFKESYSEDKVEIIREGFIIENYRETGEKYLINYYNQYKPFDQSKTLGLEQEITISFYDSLKDKTYNLVGYIDKLALISEDHIEIGDYKTNAQAKTQEEVDKDRQLAIYMIAIKKLYPFVKEISLSWYFLSAGIKQTSYRTDEQLKVLEEEVIENIRDIEDAKEKDYFPAKPSALCDWCSFRTICPHKRHDFLDKEEPISENKYLKEKGVNLVDKYQELSEKKLEVTKDIDSELALLKEAIITYSQDNNLDKLFGTNKNLLIREYDSIKLPLKDTDKRKDLETFLKNNNFLDLVSDISIYKFSDLFKSNFFTKEFEDKIKEYITREKIHRLYLNKK